MRIDSLQQTGHHDDAEPAEFAARILELVSKTRKALSRETLGDWFVNLTTENGTTAAPRRYSFDLEPYGEFDSHACFEMAMQINGDSLLQLDDHYYELHAGQIAIVQRKQVHRLGFANDAESPATMLWLSVTGDMTRYGYTVYEKDCPWKIWGCDLMIPGGFVLSEVFHEITEPPIAQDHLDAIVIALQFFLMQLERKFIFLDKSTEASWNGQVTAEIKYYIGTHLNSSLRLQELSDVVSISACHLSKVFKQATNQTVTGYILQLKMEKAVEYLVSSTLSIAQIASQLGFYDQYHFSKAFKAYTGLAPTVYRHSIADENNAKPIKNFSNG